MTSSAAGSASFPAVNRATLAGKGRPRIAWCSSTIFPAVYRHHGKNVTASCPWKWMLLERARQMLDADWMVIAPGKTELSCDFTEDGVRYVVVGQPRRFQNWTYDWRGFKEAGDLLKAWKPDLLHVHGSENYFGLLTARGILECPALIVLQGLLNPYLRTVWGPFDFPAALRIDRPMELLRGTGLLGLRRQWRLGATLEREILRGNQWFAGRTEWDCANLKAINPSAKYRTLFELLRPEFSARKWTLSGADRHSIFFTNLSGPHKGGDTLVEAIRILKQTVPNVRLRIGGSASETGGYGRHLRRAVARAGVGSSVEFVGYLDASRIAAELGRAHVFASASFMDNSPNSVGEAFTVGVPSVSSYVGGLPSMGRDGKELLFFPAGDPEALAAGIARIFADDSLAEHLSAFARARAQIFHDETETLHQLRTIYHEILGPKAGESGAGFTSPGRTLEGRAL